MARPHSGIGQRTENRYRRYSNSSDLQLKTNPRVTHSILTKMLEMDSVKCDLVVDPEVGVLYIYQQTGLGIDKTKRKSELRIDPDRR